MKVKSKNKKPKNRQLFFVSVINLTVLNHIVFVIRMAQAVENIVPVLAVKISQKLQFGKDIKTKRNRLFVIVQRVNV